MPNISIVIPVYNTEKYLKRCLNSILHQSFQDFEVILIDDGSTDRSPLICDEYTKLDNRIKAVHQINSGVSSARNLGLKIAIGEYIWFIDSDDYITVDSLRELSNILKNNNIDLIVFNTDINEFYDSKINNLDYFFKKYYFTYKLEFSSGNKLYNRYFLLENNILFDTDEKIGEDLLFNISCYDKMKKIKLINKKYYNYIKRFGSAMSSQLHSRLSDQMRLFNKIKTLLENKISLDSIEVLKMIHFVSGMNQEKQSHLNIFVLRKKLIKIYKHEFEPFLFNRNNIFTFLRYQKPSILGYIRIKLFMYFFLNKNFLLASILVTIY